MLRLTPVPPTVWANKSWVEDFEHRTIVEELMYFDIISIRPFQLTVEGRKVVFGGNKFETTMMHWSRCFEYPWAIRAIDPRIEDVILDAGGGDGLLPYSLAVRCGSVVNVDCDENMVKRVLETPLFGYFRNIRCEMGDIKGLKYPSDHFDKVLCVSVLEHMPTQSDVMAAVKEMYRVLKPGGHLVLTMDVASYARWNHSIDDKFLGEFSRRWGIEVPPRPKDVMVGMCDEISPQPGEPSQVTLTVFCAKIVKQGPGLNSA